MSRRMAIIGGGPIGIETATAAGAKGWDVAVFEAGQVGAHVRQWSHVRLFSPWSLNRSPWGETLVQNTQAPDAFPTAQDYLDTYLLPLAQTLGDALKTQTRVLGISRTDALKSEFIGKRHGNAGRFRLLVEHQGQERYEDADVVVDCTGVFEHPAALGPGGLLALGERAHADRIDRYIPDVLGQERARFAHKTTLLVGAGHSAVTSLKLLCDLQAEVPDTKIFWAFRGQGAPYHVIENDSLPQRKMLAEFGNQAAIGAHAGVTPLAGSSIEAIESAGNRLRVTVMQAGAPRVVEVDRIIANVGYRPDLSLNRELQMHLCWASEGPMKLAASLLAAAGAGGDCLAQESGGIDVLKNPEPNFFVLGARSYGRNSSFLLRLGFDQISAVLDHLG